ncbi:MAG: hypothetical protein U9R06_01475 [Patescibacteria group bacterium]|nr:hypothetical protein [Patescibacteria group bacterium]
MIIIILTILSTLIVASLLVFLSMEFYRVEKKVLAEIKEEEKELAK